MKRHPNIHNYRKEHILLSLLYAAGISAVLPYSLWFVNNPDAFQYISIAEKIAGGHFSLALNGYWSPLISWLIAVPIFFGLNGIFAFKVIQILIGIFTLTAWYRLCLITGISRWFRMAVGVSIIPFIINYALLNLTADLLFLTLVLYFLTFAISIDWIHSPKAARTLGFRGALLFFAKGFGFPLFLSLLGLSVLFSAFSDKLKLAAKAARTSLMIFLVICSFFIVPLSIRYGRFTISEAARFNQTKEVAPLPGQIMQIPVLNGPLLSPPDKYALSAWESPGDALRLTPLHPLSSAKDFSHYFQVVKRNILSIWYFDFRNQVGILFLCLLLFYLLASRWRTQKRNTPSLYLLGVAIIFYVGYSLILVHTRYIWICTWIMLLISAWMLKDLAKHVGWKNHIAKVFFLVMLVLAVKRPVKEILFTKDTNLPLLWIGKGILHPFETMRIIYRPEKLFKEAVKELKQIPEMKGPIASLHTSEGDRHAYSSSLFIAHEFASQYYGPLDSKLSPEEMKEQFQKFGISILLVWNHDVWPAKDKEWVHEIYADPDLGLTVFRLF